MEKYQPSHKEISKAEEMMSETERQMSKEREDMINETDKNKKVEIKNFIDDIRYGYSLRYRLGDTHYNLAKNEINDLFNVKNLEEFLNFPGIRDAAKEGLIKCLYRTPSGSESFEPTSDFASAHAYVRQFELEDFVNSAEVKNIVKNGLINVLSKTEGVIEIKKVQSAFEFLNSYPGLKDIIGLSEVQAAAKQAMTTLMAKMDDRMTYEYDFSGPAAIDFAWEIGKFFHFRKEEIPLLCEDAKKKRLLDIEKKKERYLEDMELEIKNDSNYFDRLKKDKTDF